MAEPSTTDLAGAELMMRRVFDAPVALVWLAWTDADHLREWMGPRDYPAAFYENDFRVGGKWKARLVSPDGGPDIWQRGEYREIVPSKRLVFTFVWDKPHPAHGRHMLVTVEFADKGATTEMLFKQQYLPSTEECDGHRYGWSSSFDRLAERLEQIAEPRPNDG